MTTEASVTPFAEGTVVRTSGAVATAVQLMGAALLGLVVLYGTGFAQNSAVHSAAHDMRHAQGFPCH